MPGFLLIRMAACHSYKRALLSLLMGADKALGSARSDRLHINVEVYMGFIKAIFRCFRACMESGASLAVADHAIGNHWKVCAQQVQSACS